MRGRDGDCETRLSASRSETGSGGGTQREISRSMKRGADLPRSRERRRGDIKWPLVKNQRNKGY
ncbi:hypothetical protein PUN28_014907 [Cardiocondyla obscurior]|uniref:Uncharacterized protein n=1 Tax=Cardiocondyla obscurior TaxID=286306 RepID=A0AAW2F231_9HYME